jgi:hypothetical protein
VSESVISVNQYSNIVRERVASLRELLLDLTRGTPQSAPRKFFESVRILIDAIEEVFESRTKAIGEDSISEEQKGSAIAFAAHWSTDLLNNVQEQFFPFLEKLDSPHIPLALLPTIQRIAKHFEDSLELYLFPTSEHNFGFSGFRNLVETFTKRFELVIPDPLIEEIRKKAEKLPRWFVFLSFPYVEYNSALHLTPLLHELGHFADFQLGIFKDVLPLDISQSDAAKKLVEEICQMTVPLAEEKVSSDIGQQADTEPKLGQILKRDVIEQQVFSSCGEIIRNWVHEIISDLFALRVAGPAYFYSFVAFAANVGLETKAAATHPSPAIRIDFMVRELNELEYFAEDSPPQIRHSLKCWADWTHSQALEPEGGTARVAYMAIEANAERLSGAVRKHSTAFSHSYGMHTFKANVPAITVDLEAGIPPIDRLGAQGNKLEPCDFADILNGAWATYTFSLDKVEGLLDCSDHKERKLRAVSTLNELVLKAIEASEILRECQNSPGTER